MANAAYTPEFQENQNSLPDAVCADIHAYAEPTMPLDELFLEWKLVHLRLGNTNVFGESYDSLKEQWRYIENQIASFKPQTARDFAIQLLVCTSYGDFKPTLQLIKAAKELALN